MTPYPIPTRIEPSDYVDFLENNKICYVWIKGRYFGNIPVTLDLKLHVMIDAICVTKVTLERNIAGPLTSISAYCFKHPPIQMTYEKAKYEFLEFIDGKKER